MSDDYQKGFWSGLDQAKEIVEDQIILCEDHERDILLFVKATLEDYMEDVQ